MRWPIDEIIRSAKKSIDLILTTGWTIRHDFPCYNLSKQENSILVCRAILPSPLVTLGLSQGDIEDEEGAKAILKAEERLNDLGWGVKFAEYHTSKDCIIVDSEKVFIEPCLTFDGNRFLKYPPLISDPHSVEILKRHFETIWQYSKPVGLIFEELIDLIRPDSAQKIVTASNDLWNDIIRYLATNPRVLYGIHPRKLEELVAELLSREGMRVELTPATKDGGRDILAFAKTNFGEHLYL